MIRLTLRNIKKGGEKQKKKLQGEPLHYKEDRKTPLL
jgi:hypothetical protein